MLKLFPAALVHLTAIPIMGGGERSQLSVTHAAIHVFFIST